METLENAEEAQVDQSSGRSNLGALFFLAFFSLQRRDPPSLFKLLAFWREGWDTRRIALDFFFP